jgi:hypothetical protein
MLASLKADKSGWQKEEQQPKGAVDFYNGIAVD